MNDSSNISTVDNGSIFPTPNAVRNIDFDRNLRLVALFIELIFGALGCALVCVWIWINRRRKSRVHRLILNLNIADILVVLLAVLPQLIWEYVSRDWRAGLAMCKIVKFMQSFSIISSSNFIVVLAIDRHQAIRSPLKDPISLWKLCGGGWLIAAILAAPQLYVYEIYNYDKTDKCEAYFGFHKDLGHRKAFLTYAFCVAYAIPFLIIAICYIRIFKKIADKDRETTTAAPGKIHLQVRGNSSLPKAKVKTLKMTVVIVVTMIVFGGPYFMTEMYMSYDRKPQELPKWLYAILGSLAVANSTTNPWVFLAFSVNRAFFRKMLGHQEDHKGARMNKDIYTPLSESKTHATSCSRTAHATTTEVDALTTHSIQGNTIEDDEL